MSFEEQPGKLPSFMGIIEQASPRADPLFRCQSRPAVRLGIVISSLCIFFRVPDVAHLISGDVPRLLEMFF